MTWVFEHSSNISLWVTTLAGLYAVYMGIQIQRRKNIPSPVKLKPAEISIGIILLVIGCFMLGIRAVRIWA
ncbi:hypothetical protein HDF12_002492 [Edaphobacter lichenicola]|uniref:Uncharacterized protein n=1 Tax=Tunturiibacter lichenicola TaxID=2051959 RepID=A0A7Y9NMX5_9BACT|nr:hypothetical protein [Edaphobacter lichenicola]